MKELIQILEAFEQLCAAGTPAALATVVAVGGSSYRRPGARMLIAEDGRTWGGVSGGCLERDVARRGRGVIPTGAPVVRRYDTAEEEDNDGRAAAALGCRGTIDIFIQPLSAASPGPLPYIGRVIRERRPVVLATILRSTGEFRAAPGTSITSSSASDQLPFGLELFNRVLLDLADDDCGVHRYELPAGVVDVFIERLRPTQSLVVFGAGSDVVPLLEIAKALGWHVTIVGSRPATGFPERFASADALLVGDAQEPTAGFIPEPHAAVVLATHNYTRDLRILSHLVNRPLGYLGVLGPRYRADRLLEELPPGEWRDHLFAPVGLDLGSNTPETIALAIVAEIQAVLAKRQGGFLRNRPGPIYARGSGDSSPEVLYPLTSIEFEPGVKTCPV